MAEAVPRHMKVHRSRPRAVRPLRKGAATGAGATQDLIILGVGGNCIDILDTVREINRLRTPPAFRCVGFLDDNRALWGREVYGVKVLGPLAAARDHREVKFVNGIGSPNNFWKRSDIVRSTGAADRRFATVIHPTASVSSMARLGHGCVVLQHVTITSNVAIGNHVIILPNSIISHDDVIGDHTAIAGGVCVSGGVKIGHSCYLGTNCCIIGNVSIGDRCLIGMGSVVIDDVKKNTVVSGNPARMLRRVP